MKAAVKKAAGKYRDDAEYEASLQSRDRIVATVSLAQSRKRRAMGCQICTTLEQAFEAGRSEYIGALGAPYHLVCKRFAAYKNVELERARNELEEHRMVCVFAARESPRRAGGALLEIVRRDEVGTNLLELSA